MNIIDKILGKKIELYDKKLGLLHTKIRTDKVTTVYTWESSNTIFHPHKPTIFVMDGSPQKPFDSHINALYHLIDNYTTYASKIQKSIDNSKEYKALWKWEDQLYLSAVNVFEDSSLELCYESLSDSQNAYILATFKGANLIEFEANN